MFLGLLNPDPDPLVRGMDPVPVPDPSISVADLDPGSGAFLTPGSGIRTSDPGSQDHIFKTFLTIFLVKSSIIL